MRKIALILTFILLTAGAFAQYKPIILGFRLGGNLGWLKPDTEGYTNEGMQPGFSWGFVGDFYFMENYAIQTGFNVDFISGKLKYPDIDLSGGDTLTGMTERKYNLRYIQVPLCLKLKTSASEKLNVYGKIGLGTAFRINAKADDNFVAENKPSVSSTKKIDDEILFIRESLIIGGGIEYILKGSTALFVEFIYDNGLVDQLTEYDPIDPSKGQKANQNFLELAIGVVF